MFSAKILHTWLQAHDGELEAVRSQLESVGKKKMALVEEVGSKQRALDHAEQQQEDTAKELAGVKKRLQGSMVSKEETAEVSMFDSILVDDNNCKIGLQS